MAIIIPRFEPGYRLFHELPPRARERIKSDSVKIRDGRLLELPRVAPATHPWLACFFVTDRTVPQIVVFGPPGGWDVDHFQRMHRFEELDPEWFWIRSLAAIQRGGRYWPSSPSGH